MKRRLVGAVVLIALGVIFIPMILDGSGRSGRLTMDVEIPPAPVYDIPNRLPAVPAPQASPPTPAAPQRSEEASLKALPSTPTVKTVEPEAAESRESKRSPEAEVAPPAAWVVQVGSFEDEAKAVALRDELRKGGFPSFVEPYRSDSGKTLYRVRVGPELKRELAEQALAKLKREHKLDGLVVTHP